MILLFAFPSAVLADDFHQVMSLSFGFVTFSLTENDSSLQSTDETVTTTTDDSPSSSSGSAISMDICYEFKTYAGTSYFLRGTAPLLASDGSGIYLGGVGINMTIRKMFFPGSDQVLVHFYLSFPI